MPLNMKNMNKLARPFIAMTAKNLAQIAIVIILGIGLVVLTAMKIMPTEVIATYAGIAITWVFEEKQKEKEITKLIANLKK